MSVSGACVYVAVLIANDCDCAPHAVRSRFPDDVDAVKIKCVALIRMEKVRIAMKR